MESSYDYQQDDEWEEGDTNWAAEGEVAPTEETGGDTKDESAAYLEFLNEEVRVFQSRRTCRILTVRQAQKFARAADDIDEDDLSEDSVLLESPLDKIEPYQLFRGTLMSKSQLETTTDRF